MSTTDSLQTRPYLCSLERAFFMVRKKFSLTFHCINSLFGRLINRYHVYQTSSPNRSIFRFYRLIIESLRRCHLAHFTVNNGLIHVLLTACAGPNNILTVWFRRERFVHAAAESVTT